MPENSQHSQKTMRKRIDSRSLRHRELFRSGEFLPGKLGLCLRSGLDRFGIFCGFATWFSPFWKFIRVKYRHLRISFFPKVRDYFKANIWVKRAKGDYFAIFWTQIGIRVSVAVDFFLFWFHANFRLRLEMYSFKSAGIGCFGYACHK